MSPDSTLPMKPSHSAPLFCGNINTGLLVTPPSHCCLWQMDRLCLYILGVTLHLSHSFSLLSVFAITLGETPYWPGWSFTVSWSLSSLAPPTSKSPCSSFTGNPPSAHVLSCSVVFDSLQPCGLQPARLLCPWDLPGKNTGVGCHPLVQGFFPTQGLSLGLPHCRQTVSHLSHQGSPVGK